MQGWSPFRLSKGPLFSCQSSGKEAKMVPFSANKWSPFRLTNTEELRHARSRRLQPFDSHQDYWNRPLHNTVQLR